MVKNGGTMNLILIHPEELDETDRVRLADQRAGHIRSVLNAEPGRTIRIGLLNGPFGRGTISDVSPDAVTLACEWEAETPPRPPIDLLLALPRPKVMKRLWAQLAALGVGRILLTNAEKVERFYFDSHVLEPDFYNARLIEGLQQARDTRLPEVRIVRELKPFVEDELDAVSPDTLRLLADPSGAQNIFQTLDLSDSESAFGIPQKKRPAGERQQSAGKVPSFAKAAAGGPMVGNVLIAVGPEGGWTPYELDLFAAHGFEIFHAGPRILRTDTACIALIAGLNQILQVVHTCAGVNNSAKIKT
jgi:RsmE family RNA methyltransferase